MSQDFTLFKQRLEESGMKKEQIENILEIAYSSIYPKKYGLVWEEQQENHVSKTKDKVLYFEEDKNRAILKGPKNQPHHLLIEGDNYDALMLLQLTHKEKVDVIYIDPPYNTGKDFSYNDDMVGKDDDWKHSKWLSFMKKRLELAQKLMKDDGIIFISIDDHEMAHLKLLCDEIFGLDNFLLNMVINRPSEIAKATTISKHEYILVYTKEKKMFEKKEFKHAKFVISRGTVGNEKQSTPEIKFPAGLKCYNISDGVYLETRKIPGSKENIQNLSPIIVENGKLKNDVILKARWRSSNDMRNFFKNNCQPTKAKISGEIVEIYFENDKFNPQIKKSSPNKLPSLYLENKKGSAELSKMGLEFSYPKSKDLIKYIFKQINLDKNSIILDFFAGSGTTAHAVLELNEEDNGSRQVILCTNNEVSEEKQMKFFKKSKEKLRQFKRENPYLYEKETEKPEFQALGICHSDTYPRLKKVINGYTTSENENIEGIPASLHYLTINETLTKKELFKTKNQLPEDKTAAILPYIQLLVQLKENIWNEVSRDDFESNNFRVFKKDNNLIFIATGYLTNKNINKIKEVYQDLGFAKGILYTFSIDVAESPIYSTLKEVGVTTRPIPRQFIDGMEGWK